MTLARTVSPLKPARQCAAPRSAVNLTASQEQGGRLRYVHR